MFVGYRNELLRQPAVVGVHPAEGCEVVFAVRVETSRDDHQLRCKVINRRQPAVEHCARVAQRVGSSVVHKVVLPRSFHILAHDLDRAEASAEIVRFAASVLGPTDPGPSTTSKPEPNP